MTLDQAVEVEHVLRPVLVRDRASVEAERVPLSTGADPILELQVDGPRCVGHEPAEFLHGLDDDPG